MNGQKMNACIKAERPLLLSATSLEVITSQDNRRWVPDAETILTKTLKLPP